MNVLKKRLIPGVLAAALMLAMAAPALAADVPQTEIEGIYEQVIIDVTVPETGTAVINPYGLPVEYKKPDASPEEIWAKVTGQQIVTQPLFIINNSDVALTVSATAVAKINGNEMKLSDEPLAADDDSKSAFIYLQAKSSTQEASTNNLDATSDLTAGGNISKEAAYKEYASWKQAYDATADIILGTRAEEAKQIGYLMGRDASGSNLVYGKGTVLMVRLSGSVVEEPRTAWSDRDGFTATISFTFRPASTGVNVTKDSATSGDLAGDVITFSATDGEIQLTAALADTSVDIDNDVSSITWASSGDETITPTNEKTVTIQADEDATAATEKTVTVTIVGKNGLTYKGEFTVKYDV